MLIVDLAGWAEAWLHEPRGYHGEWIKAGTGLDRYSVPPHSRLIARSGPKASRDPAHSPFFTAHPVSPANVIASYDASSPQERAQGARWYADAHALATKITGGDAREGAILLASYSPQSSWPVNMFNATRAAEEHRALGPGDGMITHAMQANAQDALDGKSVDESMTSPKTRAFARLIELGGDSPTDGAGEVVVDRHALNVAAGATLPKSVTDKSPIGDPRYHEYVADQYRQAALQISHRDGVVMTPYQLQAITWLHQQAIAQAMDEAGGAARGGQALQKGRITSLARAWARWQQLAKSDNIPLTANTGLAGEYLLPQLLELSGWHDAYLHELRGRGGRWVRGEQVVDYQPVIDRIGEMRHRFDNDGDYVSSGSLDNAITALDQGDVAEARRQLAFASRRRSYNGYKDDARTLDQISAGVQDASEGKQLGDPAQHVNIDRVWQSIGNLADDASLVGQDDLSRDISVAQGALHGGTADDFHAAELYLNDAAKRAEILGYKGLAKGLRTQAGLVHAAKPETVAHSPARSVQKFLAGQAVPAVAKILGGTQNWNGNVTLVSRTDWPFTYGEMTWGRSMRLRQDIAEQVADDLAHPNNPIHDPHSYEVILHELIHGVGGPSDDVTADMDAFQDERMASIEEGFTELGATQHAAEFADAVGIGNRGLPPEDMTTRQQRSAHPPDVSSYAAARDTPQAINGPEGPWGHYSAQTRAALAWVREVASGEGVHGGAAVWKRATELSDEINRVGTAAKPRVMAEQIARTVDHLDPSKMTPNEWDAIISNILAGFGPDAGVHDLHPADDAKFRAKIIAQKQMERERENAA